jgi:dCTP deaminase
MILNDTQITRLCVPPKFMVKRYVPHKPDYNATTVLSVFIVPSLVEFPSYQTEAEIQEEIKNSDPSNYRGTVSYRILTEAEYLNFRPMIEDFVEGQIKTKQVINRNQDGSFKPLPKEEQRIVSFGLSSFGYDFRIAKDFKIFTNINSTVVDPLNFNNKCFVDFTGDVCIVPPNSFVLARTVERFNMPKNIVGVCTGKSTIARSGLSIMVTPLEPGWEGYLTLEYANTTPLPVKLYANMGGGQIMFYKGDCPEVTYADRDGKYQDQGPEVVTLKV